MKRIMLSLSALVLTPLLFAQAGDAELRFSWWGGGERHEATLAAIAAYEAKNPGVKIKSEYMGWDGYLERITTQIGSSSEPDIMQLDWAWLAIFSKNGDGFYDMNDAKDVLDLGSFEKKWLDSTTVKGKLNALPVSFTTRYFLWNKTMFDKAGVPLPKTWDDLLAAGRAFKEKLGDDYYPLDSDLPSVPVLLQSYLFQKTGKMFIDPESNEFTLTPEEMKFPIQMYRDLLDNHAITPMAVRVSVSGNAGAQTYEQPDFVEGRWAGMYLWDSNITLVLSTPKKEFSFELGDFLTMSGAKNSGRIGRPAMIFAISKNSKNPKVAAAVVNFLLTTPEAARILKTTRGPLLSGPSYETLLADKLIAPFGILAKDQIRDVEVYTPSPYFENPRMLQLLDEVLENVSYGKYTVDEAADELCREIPRLLQRLKR